MAYIRLEIHTSIFSPFSHRIVYQLKSEFQWMDTETADMAVNDTLLISLFSSLKGLLPDGLDQQTPVS